MLARHGLEGDRFLEQPWKSGQSGGRQYAIPLDTHPFVLYYNTDLVEEAGLLDGEGKLKPLDGEGALLDACEAVKDKTGKTGLVFETRGVTPWRVFLTLYRSSADRRSSRRAAPGSRWTTTRRSARSSGWPKPAARGVGGPDVDYQGSVAFFSNQSAAFALNGEWEVTTYEAMKLPFGMRTVPTVFDRPATQADSHTFVIPRDAGRSPARLDAALAFISRLVNKGLDWAKGGHVPAYRAIFESDDYRKLSPQSDYASAVDDLVFDPLAWYSGSGSNLEANAGSAFSPVVTGSQKPEQGLRTFRDYLDRMSKTAEARIGGAAAWPPPLNRCPASSYVHAARRARDPRTGRVALLFTAPFFVALRAVPVLAGAVRAADVAVRRVAGRRLRRGRDSGTTASCWTTRTSGRRCGTRPSSRSSACRRSCCSRSGWRCW